MPGFPSTRIAARSATLLWEGDLIVVGAGLPGMACALRAAGSGLRTCLVEPGPVLAPEITGMWLTRLPTGPIGKRLTALCRRLGGVRGDRIDPLIAALAADQIPEEAGVETIVRLLPLRVFSLADTLGLEVVGKSGRQLLRARWIVDTTPDHRLSGGAPTSAAGGGILVQRRILLAGARPITTEQSISAPKALGLQDDLVRISPTVWPGEILAEVAVHMPANASEADRYFRSQHAALEAAAWLRSSQPEFAGAFAVAVSPIPRVIPPAGTANAGIRFITHPDLPELPEALAALQSAFRADAVPAKPAPTPPPTSAFTQSSELTAAPEWDLPAIELPPLEARLHPPYDIVVCGFGAAGAFAALAAASHGLRVAVIDPSPYPGGMGTAGNIHSYYFGTRSGLQDLLDEQVSGKAARIAGGNYRGYHPLAKAEVLAEALVGSSVQVFSGQVVFGAVREGDRVRAVLSAGTDGAHAFPCMIAIDATGDGDLAAAAGAPYLLGREGDGFPQPYSYTPSYIDRGKLWHRNFDAGWVDPTDSIAYSRAHFEGRRQIRRQGPFTEDRHYCTLAPLLGIRESRFIQGKTRMVFEDVLEGRRPPDAVCTVQAHYDNHAMDYANESDWGRRYVTYFGLWRTPFQGRLPFGTLTPKGIRGLLIACRAVSVDHDMHQLLRMQRDMQQIGEVAGHAAARAVQLGATPDALDFAEIRSVLETRNILPAEPPAPQADQPASELLHSLRDPQTRGRAMWRLCRRADTDASTWTAFFAAESDEDARFCGALAAVLTGQNLHEPEAILRAAIDARRTTPKLGEKAPPAFLAAAMALAEDHRPGAARALGEILLHESLAVWDTMLALKGLELAADPQAIPDVKQFLEIHADDPFEAPMWGCAPQWKTSFRPQVEMRAVCTLLALGDPSERQRLEPYTMHENLLIRRYARRLLRQAEAAKRK